MVLLKWIVVALVGYGGLVTLLYLAQRSLQYFPETFRTAPAEAGMPEAQETTLDAPDGARLIAWHVPPREGKPVILYFHGNGGSLRYRVDRYRALVRDGTGLLALSYRGYGGSSGGPSEPGLIADAEAAHAFAAAHYPAERIVLWGESLGSGVAVAIAATRSIGRMVLQAPFTSAADVGALRYWFAPVRLLMKDQFRSDLRIGAVTAPVLVLHGERDTIVPISLGERLYELIKAPKRFVRFPGYGHNDLGVAAVEAARTFVADGIKP
jgi:pimeloyl-ACP methyl ester carboxylesterase